MYVSISDLVPNPDDLLRLEVEELAGVLLMHLNNGGELHHHNFFNGLRNYPPYPQHLGHNERVGQALMEAWDWLAYEGFLARRAGSSGESSAVFVTRRGQRMKSREDFEAYRKANLLPKGQLHPLIASKVYPAFLRGEYDTAVFQAFREVEISVRQAGQFPADVVGEKLMRAAFAPAKSGSPGPLVDNQLPAGEQEAMSHLFAGAFGLYRNSTAHRYVPTRPEEAAEVIMFASQLLRIVDRLKPQQGQQP